VTELQSVESNIRSNSGNLAQPESLVTEILVNKLDGQAPITQEDLSTRKGIQYFSVDIKTLPSTELNNSIKILIKQKKINKQKELLEDVQKKKQDEDNKSISVKINGTHLEVKQCDLISILKLPLTSSSQETLAPQPQQQKAMTVVNITPGKVPKPICKMANPMVRWNFRETPVKLHKKRY